MQASMKLFPKCAETLGLHDAVIKGLDMKIHDEPEAYREDKRFQEVDR
jgi:hypothetical protein